MKTCPDCKRPVSHGLTSPGLCNAREGFGYLPGVYRRECLRFAKQELIAERNAIEAKIAMIDKKLSEERF
jgi:hypothetical protein